MSKKYEKVGQVDVYKEKKGSPMLGCFLLAAVIFAIWLFN